MRGFIFKQYRYLIFLLKKKITYFILSEGQIFKQNFNNYYFKKKYLFTEKQTDDLFPNYLKTGTE